MLSLSRFKMADCEARCRQVEQIAVQLLDENRGLLNKVRRALLSSDEEAVRGVVETVKFLWLVSSDRQRGWTPAHRVDLVWHELILFTRGYEAFCRECLGGFVHHQPSDNHAENQLAFESTLIAYRTWFGEPDERFWGNRRTAVAACGTCDTGEN